MNSFIRKKFEKYYPKFFKIIRSERISNLLLEADYHTLLFLKDFLLEIYDPKASLDSSDVLYIDSNPINIEYIRYITKFSSYKPDNLKYRFIIIMNIENLTPEAGNALLKSLEESKEYVIFISLTSNSHKILKTILSRSMNFKLNPVNIQENIPEKISKSINGSLGRYLFYLENKSNDLKIENIEDAVNIYVNSFTRESLYIFRDKAFEFLENYEPLQVSKLIEEKSKKIDKSVKTAIISYLCEYLADKNYKEIEFAIKIKNNLKLNLNFSTTILVILKKIFNSRIINYA